MLIATLPGLQRQDLMRRIISHPLIGGVRYNVGAASPYPPGQTLRKIQILTDEFGKKFWVDLKGRQLRIDHWSHRLAGTITLNHKIDIDLPATILFRGDDECEIKYVDGNRIYVDPPPRYSVGEGQSVNIHAASLHVHGYLTDLDKAYIKSGVGLGIYRFMGSFIECKEDVLEIEQEIEENSEFPINPEINFKIETLRGMEFIRNFPLSERSGNYSLMAARDDLITNIGQNKAAIIPALEEIIRNDPEAILASRIFSALEGRQSEPSMGDWSDIRLMQLIGYKHFMLSDELCSDNFEKALCRWKDYCAVYPFAE